MPLEGQKGYTQGKQRNERDEESNIQRQKEHLQFKYNGQINSDGINHKV